MKLGPNALAFQPRGLLTYGFPVTFAYGGLFANIYHPYGWIYQLRRTWHGIIWCAMKYTKPRNPRTQAQQNWRYVFRDGVSIWRNTMTDEEKNFYNQKKYPERMSGFNRFLHYYLREH